MDEDVRRYMKQGFRYILNILIIFELLSLIHYFLIALGVVTPLETIAGLEEHLYEFLRPAAPLLFLLILFSWITLIRKPSGWPPFSHVNINFKMGRVTEFLLKNSLKLALLLSIVGALYPWSSYVNPDHEAFGVDSRKYKTYFLEDFEPSSLLIIQPRMGLKLPIYFIHVLFNLDYSLVIDYIPVIIHTLLVLSVYFLVDTMWRDRTLAGLSALLMSMSFNITVGQFSYYLSNNFGLVYMFISLAYLMKDLMKEKGYTNPVSLFFGCLVIFTHPWVFFQYYGTLLLFLGVLYLRKRELRSLSPLIIYLTVLGICYLSSKLLITSYIVGNESRLVVEKFFRPQDFIGSNLFTFNKLYTGLLGNTVFLALSLIGVKKMDRESYFDVFLWCMLFATSLVYVFTNMTFNTLDATNYIPSRLIYNLPLCVLSGYGCKWILEHPLLESVNTRMVWFLILSMSVYLFRSLSSLI